MSIISQETWDNMPKEEKEKIKKDYRKMLDGKTEFTEVERNGAVLQMEWLIGKENLQPIQKIKTWEDCQEMNEDSNFFMRIDDNLELSDKVYSKCIAALKIAKLIELGYGGVVSEEEWEERINEGTGFYTIVYSPLYKSFHIKVESCNKQFIAFHTSQHAEEFMSYPENIKLLEQYNLL